VISAATDQQTRRCQHQNPAFTHVSALLTLIDFIQPDCRHQALPNARPVVDLYYRYEFIQAHPETCR
ncbi:MAG TPA: hypothetical protein VLE50_11590, partial [Cellvibrio sp.]|nr:hypothetical protein [Cellvibrio sp.]